MSKRGLPKTHQKISTVKTMSVIVLKYVQLVCVAFLFDNIKCENLALGAAARDDVLLNREAGCMVACMEANSTVVLRDCYNDCKGVTATVTPFNQTQSDEAIELICRDSDSLTVKVISQTAENISKTNSNSQRKYAGELYLVTLQQSDDEFPQKIVYIADTPIIKVKNLTQSTSYHVMMSVFTGRLEYRHSNRVHVFQTLENDQYKPHTISNETIEVNYSINSESGDIFSSIIWTPADDMVCHYMFNLYGTIDPIHVSRRLINPEQLYLFETPELKFDSEYVVEIAGANTKNESIEGTKNVYIFWTPTCWEYHNNNLNLCRPMPVTNISSTHELLRKDHYKINVTWNAQEYQPDRYNVTINMFSNGSAVSQSVPGTQNHASFPEVYIPEMSYDIHVLAESLGGISIEGEMISLKDIYTSFWERYKRILTGAGILLLLTIVLSVSLILLAIQNRRNKFKRKNELLSREMYLREMAQTHNKDEMEIDPSNIKLLEVLGEGAFGIVRKGILLPTNQFVAAKMLKENAGVDDIEGFLREIALMKSVFRHENIVGIVGHLTMNYNKMMLLTEYCSKGNLLNYLRNYRQQWSMQHIVKLEPSCAKPFVKPSEKSPENIFNFDSPIVNKLSPKEKSISLSVISQEDVSDPNIHNVISNRLYNECIIETIGCKELIRNDIITNKLRPSAIDHADSNGSHYYPNAKKLKLVNQSANRLFAENQCYDMLLPSEQNCKFIEKQSMMNSDNELASSNGKVHNKIGGDKLVSKDLLMFAKQIASGMEFLANHKIVHRDLAARNVLVCEDRTVKIADFGLSRDIYEDNIYMKSSAGRLPIKWLALESMIQQQYTSQSDVWSYGILLYEIVTLGCTPYPTVPVDCLVNYLKSGNRMSKPHNCSQEFYNLMASCWHCEPEERPTFTDILRQLDYFILHYKTNEMIHVDISDKNECFEQPITVEDNSNTSYLKPI